MMMQYNSLFSSNVRNVVSPDQESDDIVYDKSVVLCSLSSELLARFGWLGFSPPNTEGWRIPLLELSPFDVSPSKREHWMKVWKKWKEGDQNEPFPYSLVYLYGRNKLALYPMANVVPFAEAKRLGLNLPPLNIQRKIQYHQKFTAKEQKLMRGFDEFTKDVCLAPRRRIAKRVSALESKESPSPRQASNNLGGRNIGALKDSSNRDFSRVVSPPESVPPPKTIAVNRSRSLDAESIELLRQSNPFRSEILTSAPTISYPPGFEHRDSLGGLASHQPPVSAVVTFVQPPTFERRDDVVESDDLLERCVSKAGWQVWNARSPYPIAIDHTAIQANFHSALDVSTTKFTKLVNHWLVHKRHVENAHCQWFKEFLWSAKTDSDNPWETPPRRKSLSFNLSK